MCDGERACQQGAHSADAGNGQITDAQIGDGNAGSTEIADDIQIAAVAEGEQGHQAGDDLIKLVANAIESAFPGQAYRIGGDEFVAVCPNMVQDEFEQKLEIVRKKVGSGATAKASLGAQWSAEVLDLYKIVDCAYEKMYEMKKIYHESNG